jgi:hypothetical protein
MMLWLLPILSFHTSPREAQERRLSMCLRLFEPAAVVLVKTIKIATHYLIRSDYGAQDGNERSIWHSRKNAPRLMEIQRPTHLARQRAAEANSKLESHCLAGWGCDFNSLIIMITLFVLRCVTGRETKCSDLIGMMLHAACMQVWRKDCGESRWRNLKPHEHSTSEKKRTNPLIRLKPLRGEENKGRHVRLN